MQLLGNYQSTLTSAFYQQLVTLLQQAIQSGDYAGGQIFDQTALQALQAQAQNFSTLPQPAAGQLTTDETFNYPLGLLAAQYAALATESSAFSAQWNSLLAVLNKDTALIDQLLAEAAFQSWISTVPSLSNSTRVMWDFGVGYGPIADPAITALWTDPLTGATYNSSSPSLVTDLIPLQGSTFTGLAAAAAITSTPANNLIWTYPSDKAQVEVLSQDTWTKLSLLEPEILINFDPTPSVSPQVNPFIIGGISTLGCLPVYVRTSFVSRRRQTVVSVLNGVSVSLSPYVVETDKVYVFINFGASGQRMLANAVDYTVDEFGNFTALTLPGGTASLAIFFEEDFPAYQCSIDQVNWSPLRMLDPAKPYPDTEKDFLPIVFSTDSNGNQAMPITDELGVPTGMYIELGTAAPIDDYVLEVMSSASSDTVGATAVLEVDFARFGYLNVLEITPFTTFPMILKKVELQGLTDNTRQTVWNGSLAITQPTAIRLDQVLGATPLVFRAFLTFYQPNYSLKQQTVTPSDDLRRSVMLQLQRLLPFAARNVAPPLPSVYTGAQYEFGVADVSGQSWIPAPGMFISGPNRFVGCPEVVRFDASFSSTLADPPINFLPNSAGTSGALAANTFIAPTTHVDFYLCYQAFNAAGAVIDQNLSGIVMTSGECLIFPFTSGVVRAQVDHVDLFVKIIHRTATTIVERYMLQVTAS